MGSRASAPCVAPPLLNSRAFDEAAAKFVSKVEWESRAEDKITKCRGSVAQLVRFYKDSLNQDVALAVLAKAASRASSCDWHNDEVEKAVQNLSNQSALALVYGSSLDYKVFRARVFLSLMELWQLQAPAITPVQRAALQDLINSHPEVVRKRLFNDEKRV